MNKDSYLLFNNHKHFSLEYIRYPIGMAFQIFKSDLLKVDCSKELRVVAKRWKLAEMRFTTDRRRVLSSSETPGAISKAEEYQYYLRAANQLLNEKELNLVKVKGI